MHQTATKHIQLSVDDHDTLERLKQASGEDGIELLLDYDVRYGLCESLSLLGSSITQLIRLLAEHQVSSLLPAAASANYKTLLLGVSEAAIQASSLVQRSQRLDKAAYLAVLPEPSKAIQ